MARYITTLTIEIETDARMVDVAAVIDRITHSLPSDTANMIAEVQEAHGRDRNEGTQWAMQAIPGPTHKIEADTNNW